MTEPTVIGSAGRHLMATFRAYGIDTMFGIPGTHNLEFYRHMRSLGIRAVTCRHEQGAGYAADGWAQQTGLPGVVVTTSGPGLLNAMSAIGTAYCESRPLIVVSPGPPLGWDAVAHGSLHATKNASEAVGAIAQWSRRVASASEAVDAVHDAFALFRSGRPRPVHIEIPLDVLESEVSIACAQLAARPRPPIPSADRAAIVGAVSELLRAKRPVILAGGGATAARDELRMIAEALGAPLVTTMNGKGTLDESHPLAVGSQLRLSTALALVDRSDVLLAIGTKLGMAELWDRPLTPGGIVIRVDIDVEQLDAGVPADIRLIGDAQAIAAQLREGVQASGRVPAPAWLDLDSVRTACQNEARDIAPAVYAAAATIADAIPGNAIVAGDSSQITYLGVASTVLSTRPHSFLYMATFATLGYGLPAAIGAAIANPSRPVVCVLGDGALMFAVQELATAVENDVDVTVVCVDNGGYAEIAQNEIDRGIDPIGVRLRQPDWVDLAKAFGANGHRISDLGTVFDTISGAIARPGVDVIHLPMRMDDEWVARGIE